MSKLNIILTILLVVLEVPAAIFLVVAWIRDCRKAKECLNKEG